MSTEPPPTPAVPPDPSVGLGTYTGLAGVILAWLAAIGAVVTAIADEGEAFYTNPNVTALVGAAIVATLGFFGARSYQAGKIYEGTDLTKEN